MNENEKALQEQLANLQQQLAEIKKNTAPKPPRDYFVLKLLGGIVGTLLLITLLWYLWACFWPLPDDDSVRKAGEEAHEAWEELYRFRGTYEPHDDPSCSVCHPSTWRYEVRKIRGQAP